MPYDPDLSDVTSGGSLDPAPEQVHDDNHVLNEIKRLTNPLLWSTVAGEAYRVSKRTTLDDGGELIVHIDPADVGGTVHIATPAIEPDEACDVDVWENADPGTSTNDDLFVHAMRYDVSPETPEATVTRVTSGGLDTSSADQTEQTHISAGGDYNTPGDSPQRGIWRTIPVGETVSFVITDRSGGNSNIYGFDTVIYEGDILPD